MVWAWVQSLMGNWDPSSCAAAAAAKSLQSCPTLCDPMGCSPPGSSGHRISQARILECSLVYICMSLSHVWLFATPWTIAHEALSVHGISQTRILERVAISFSSGSSWPRDWTHISCIGKWILYRWATGDAHSAQSADPVPPVLYQPPHPLGYCPQTSTLCFKQNRYMRKDLQRLESMQKVFC